MLAVCRFPALREGFNSLPYFFDKKETEITISIVRTLPSFEGILPG